MARGGPQRHREKKYICCDANYAIYPAETLQAA